jgi:hypothetical protein
MSFIKMRITDGSGFSRSQAQGDLIGGAEKIPASIDGTTAAVITPVQFLANFLTVSGATTATTLTTDTATNMQSSITFNQGDSYRLKVLNPGTGPVTIAGGTGVTVSNGVVNLGSVKDFLINITAAGPAVVVAGCGTTNGNKIITGMTLAQTSQIKIGQLMTGTGAGASAKVVGIQPGIGVTVDVNSTATGTSTLTFSPSMTVTGLGQGLV